MWQALHTWPDRREDSRSGLPACLLNARTEGVVCLPNSCLTRRLSCTRASQVQTTVAGLGYSTLNVASRTPLCNADVDRTGACHVLACMVPTSTHDHSGVSCCPTAAMLHGCRQGSRMKGQPALSAARREREQLQRRSHLFAFVAGGGPQG